MTVYEVSMCQLPEFACKDAQGNFFKFGMQQVYYIQAPPSKIWLGMNCPITDKDWIEVEQVILRIWNWRNTIIVFITFLIQ